MATYTCNARSASANEVHIVLKYTLGLCSEHQTGPCCMEADPEILEEQRKLWINQRDLMVEYQKMCGASKDIEGAKFFKEEARHALKMYRAACLLIPWFSPPAGKDYPGDCVLKDPYDFPEELFSHLDYIYSISTLDKKDKK